MLIAFDGTGYNGWQRQKHGVTIQSEIEDRLVTMTGERIVLHGAGRTDAGVHAEGMVANFHTVSGIPCPAFSSGLNSMLPAAIRILAADEVDESFHARFSARGKHYLYRLYCGAVQMPQQRLYSLHHPAAIDVPAVRACLSMLEGTHDFASFENTGSRDRTIAAGRGSVRTLYTVGFQATSHYDYEFSFVGDGFLRQMVRNIVGTLLEVGRGKRSVDEFRQVLLDRERTAAGPTAQARGLTLKEVFY